MAPHFTSNSYTGNTAARVGAAPYQPVAIFQCKDGYVDIQCMTEEQWQRLVQVMGDPDWAHLEIFRDTFARAENWEALEPLLSAWFMQQTKQEFYLKAQAGRVASAPVNTVEDLMKSEHLAARGFFVEAEQPDGGRLKLPGPLVRLSHTTSGTSGRAPRPGEHNEEIYCGRLGYTRQDLVRMRNAGVI
jgi:crotonobetainyl-CoA:carnitine CoA-transferase CaiB-like acyl-CoA transferase